MGQLQIFARMSETLPTINQLRPAATALYRRTPGRTHQLQRGFTLIELVTLMVLVAVLSFVALPPLLTDELRAAPAADHIAAELRYAQSLAMTRGENHTFEISGNTFRIRDENGAIVPLSDGAPSGDVGALSLSGSSITFSSLFGQPGGSGSITVSGGGTSFTVTVAANTGYVRVQ